MPRPLIALALSAAISTSALAAETYTVDPNHTMPIFEISHLGLTTQRGRFNKVEGRITLDTAAGKGSVELSIDVASIDMGLAKWSEQMRSEDYFNAASFPTMRFTSDKLLFAGDKVVGAEGTFTLLGVARPLTLTITGFNCRTNPFNKKMLCGGDVSASIKRSDFGMTKSIPAIGDEVRLLIPLEAVKD